MDMTDDIINSISNITIDTNVDEMINDITNLSIENNNNTKLYENIVSDLKKIITLFNKNNISINLLLNIETYQILVCKSNNQNHIATLESLVYELIELLDCSNLDLTLLINNNNAELQECILNIYDGLDDDINIGSIIFELEKLSHCVRLLISNINKNKIHFWQANIVQLEKIYEIIKSKNNLELFKLHKIKHYIDIFSSKMFLNEDINHYICDNSEFMDFLMMC